VRPREGGLRRGENFWLRLTTASAQGLRLSERFFFISAVMQVMHVFDILTCWLSLLREFSANRIS